ncbi:hypothetical protein ABIF29_002281 [Bradyrhizobium elkanii]|uniref:Transporter n=1 Tax=Bradyrhizobium elkanii TaxID=29448 RepID=A0ABV4EXH5_BRAEL|nr:hypothetical protein [Bradyrhizobium elkanii]MCP1982016.1 hypothetical protein [Bradyrhizobium elkanii]MCS3883200.1 hypothetical protein [Bradyrhizobium elkanii]MCS4217743.1 hypothetical protein [Bradyrhizobium elkanii]MCW2195807.1 hypothetical protein [Bradyrhizobium elkanii]
MASRPLRQPRCDPAGPRLVDGGGLLSHQRKCIRQCRGAREIQVGRIPAAANVNLNLHLNAQADLILLNPTYTFATPVLGGQLAIGVTGLFGRSSADLARTLTAAVGPLATTRTGSFGDSITSVGDLYPQATLKWSAGVHNFMTYVTGDVPVGAYSPSSLANLGIGHAAIDAGGGYTYFNPQAGHEFSAVGGFTYNFKNQDTQYQNGIDFHLDWGASQFLSKQVFVGLVGYAYQQVTDDFGQHPVLGAFGPAWWALVRRSASCLPWATCRVI